MDWLGTGGKPLPELIFVCWTDIYMSLGLNQLTHRGWVTHICVSKEGGSYNGLSPVWHQAIIWTTPGLLFIGILGTKFYEKLIKIWTIFMQGTIFENAINEMVAILSQPQCQPTQQTEQNNAKYNFTRFMVQMSFWKTTNKTSLHLCSCTILLHYVPPSKSSQIKIKNNWNEWKYLPWKSLWIIPEIIHHKLEMHW